MPFEQLITNILRQGKIIGERKNNNFETKLEKYCILKEEVQ